MPSEVQLHDLDSRYLPDTIQDDVANAVARQIQIKVRPGEVEQASRPVNAEAYDAVGRQ